MSKNKPLGVAKHDIKAGDTITVLIGSDGVITSPDIELSAYGLLFFGLSVMRVVVQDLEEEIKQYD